MASLWDRENANATVNVKTCPASKTHGSPFTPPIGDKGALYFSPYKPLDRNIRLPEASAERRSATWTLQSLSPSVSLALSLSLSAAFHSLHRRDRHRQNKWSATRTSDTDKSSQTCLILSGWHSKIRRESLNINLSFQHSIQRQTKPQSK